jgi:hypothetical protein
VVYYFVRYLYFCVLCLFAVPLPPGKPHLQFNLIIELQMGFAVQFNNSILYYLCAESTARRPITDTVQRRYNKNNNNNNNNNTIIQSQNSFQLKCSNNNDDEEGFFRLRNVIIVGYFFI